MRGRGVGRMNGRGYKRTIVEMETSDFDDGRSKDNRNSSADRDDGVRGINKLFMEKPQKSKKTKQCKAKDAKLQTAKKVLAGSSPQKKRMRKDNSAKVVGDWEKLEENVGNQDISNTDEISELVESDVENSLLMEEKLLWSIDV